MAKCQNHRICGNEYDSSDPIFGDWKLCKDCMSFHQRTVELLKERNQLRRELRELKARFPEINNSRQEPKTEGQMDWVEEELTASPADGRLISGGARSD